MIIQFKYNVPFLNICLYVLYQIFFFLFLYYFRFIHSVSLFFHVFSSLIYFSFTLILLIAELELRTACFESGNYIEDSFPCPSIGIGACVIMSCAQRRTGVPCHLHYMAGMFLSQIAFHTRLHNRH
jgi:hypothetical protein